MMEMVFYRVRRINNRYYLVKEWYDPSTGKKKTTSRAPCDKIEEFLKKCGGRDLNPGSPAWEAGVLDQARRPPLHFFCLSC